MLERAIGKRDLEVTAGTKDKDATTSPAAAVWRSAKPFFEKQAGLARFTDTSGVQRIRFRSAETTELADQWAWNDPEALFSIFNVASQMNILFGNLGDDEEHGMFRSYMAAAVQLARRSPGLFGASWLETLARDYSAWVHSQRNEIAGQNWEIFALLAHRVNEVKERRLWRHFARRMGMLLNQLFRDGVAPLVSQFIERLFKQGLHELALRIIMEIGEARETKMEEDWLSEIMHQGDEDARHAVIQEIALEVSWDVPRSGLFLRKISEWTTSKNDAVRRAALAFPAVLFDKVTRKEFDWKGETSPLLDILASPSSVTGGTMEQFCTSLVTQGDFAEGAAEQLAPDELSGWTAGSFAVALMLYQHACGLPDAKREKAMEFCRTLMRSLPLTDRVDVRKWWNEFSQQLIHTKNRVASGSASERSKRVADLERRYSLCNKLIQV